MLLASPKPPLPHEEREDAQSTLREMVANSCEAPHRYEGEMCSSSTAWPYNSTASPTDRLCFSKPILACSTWAPSRFLVAAERSNYTKESRRLQSLLGIGPANRFASQSHEISRSSPERWSARLEDQVAMFMDDVMAGVRMRMHAGITASPLPPEEHEHFLRMLGFFSEFVAAVLGITVDEARSKLLALDITGNLMMHTFKVLISIGGPAPPTALRNNTEPGPKPLDRMSSDTRRRFDLYVECARCYERNSGNMFLNLFDYPFGDRWSLNQDEFKSALNTFFDGVSNDYQLARQAATH